MALTSSIDKTWMRLALNLARRGEGLTSPNPCVGAVLVRGKKLIGEGFHARAGQAHAEVAAVTCAQKRGYTVKGSTLYVTLEPCSTQGRTPPCTDLILREKIARVVVATSDPNPAHAGRAYRLLRSHGVKVSTGVLAREAKVLNRDFNHFITSGRPWVVAKMALSLDRRIAPPAGESPWITSTLARQKGHELRWRSDAIVVGAETVRTDNPHLTVRLPGRTGKTQPWRVILTRSGHLPPHAHLFTDAHRDRTLVFQKKSWSVILHNLAQRGCKQVMLEGGGKLITSALRAGIVNEVWIFIAPKILGAKARALPPDLLRATITQNAALEPVGPDYLLRALL